MLRVAVIAATLLCWSTAMAVEPKSYWEVRYYREKDDSYLTENDFRTCIYGRIAAIKLANRRRAEKGIHAVQVFHMIQVNGRNWPAECVEIEYDINPERLR